MKPNHHLFHLLLFAFILFSCQQKAKNGTGEPAIIPPPHTRLHEITLMDSLGKMSIYLPEEYDTCFQWIHYLDCGDPCATVKYRCQSKKLVIDPERDFLTIPIPSDTLNQFNIRHSLLPYGAPDSLEKNFLTLHNTIRESYLYDSFRLDSLIRDTVIFGDSKPISLWYFKGVENYLLMPSVKVQYTTIIRNQYITLEFLLGSKKGIIDENQFFQKSLQMLQTSSFEESK